MLLHREHSPPSKPAPALPASWMKVSRQLCCLCMHHVEVQRQLCWLCRHHSLHQYTAPGFACSVAAAQAVFAGVHGSHMQSGCAAELLSCCAAELQRHLLCCSLESRMPEKLLCDA